jgi:hypothetical protein
MIDALPTMTKLPVDSLFISFKLHSVLDINARYSVIFHVHAFVCCCCMITAIKVLMLLLGPTQKQTVHSFHFGTECLGFEGEQSGGTDAWDNKLSTRHVLTNPTRGEKCQLNVKSYQALASTMGGSTKD